MSPGRRQGERVAFFEKYILSYNGKDFECLLENFSNSGVLVSCENLKERVRPGDFCTITISAAPPNQVKCRIARQHLNLLGLEFRPEI